MLNALPTRVRMVGGALVRGSPLFVSALHNTEDQTAPSVSHKGIAGLLTVWCYHVNGFSPFYS